MTAVESNVAVPNKVPAGSPWDLPNLVTLSRFALSVVLFALMDLTNWWLASAALFLFASGTDFVDGLLARRLGMITVLGRILDPFVDKIIVCGTFLFLLPHPESGVTATMAVIIVGRELLVTTLRSWLEQQGRDFSAAMTGKIKMVLQCAALALCLASLDPRLSPWFPPGSLAGICRATLLWCTVAITVYSGAIYIIRAIDLFREERATHQAASQDGRP
jgi:CDP-diacylglycerol--glycerol-3-phosphate 3-phosphatidyltransferase